MTGATSIATPPPAALADRFCEWGFCNLPLGRNAVTEGLEELEGSELRKLPFTSDFQSGLNFNITPFPLPFIYEQPVNKTLTHNWIFGC